MSEKSKLRYELRKQLKALHEIRGSGTELISVYIPPGYPISEVSNKLKAEYGQAENIKSKSTRSNVTGALEKIIHYLKMFNKPPENGMAIFAGNVSTVPGKPDLKIFSLSPHEPIAVQTYRCDSSFFLDPLDNLIAAKDSYGLVVMDGREATVAILNGTQTRIIKRLNSTAHAKIHKGGQSANRYQRLIEEAIEKYYVRIGEAMDMAFVGQHGLKGVIVGGPGPAKDGLMKMHPWNYQIKILGVVDTGYTDEYGIREVQEKSAPLIAEQEAVREKKLVDAFIKEVVQGGLAAYGEKDVREALEAGKVDTLLVSEQIDWKRVSFKCSSCGQEIDRLMREPKEEDHECGGKLRIQSVKEVAEELLELAEQTGVKIEMVSSYSVEGNQFLTGFYGIGAFLRYK